MSKANRHPGRTWFGDVPVRTLADAERESRTRVIARQAEHGTGANAAQGTRDVQGNEPKHAAAKATGWVASTHAAGATSPTPDPLTSLRLATRQCEQQANSLFADRLLQPEEIRKRYPCGWLTAPYRPMPAAMVALLVRGAAPSQGVGP